ncbi:MAG: 2-hydroxyacyl-CoA dehydratase family protein [bacterium]|nr:2-hydroxyacyl-CoA dehydratase family protein [bacterium]
MERVIRAYSSLIKKNLDKPELVKFLIRLGLEVAKLWVDYTGDKYVPESLRYLNSICFKFILEPLREPENSGFVNLLAPTEILHSMDIYPLFIEAYSSFTSGFYCEDILIDKATTEGISDTLCSYHKAFLGALEFSILPRLKFALTSSILCDGNSNTFRYIAKRYEIPYLIIDIPYEYSEESVSYVVSQLKEMISMIEAATQKRFDIDRLREIIRLENESKKYLRLYLEELKSHTMPNSISLEMYKLFVTHPYIGREETSKFFKLLAEDITKYPNSGYRVFWVHIMPYFSYPIQRYLNFNEDFNLIGCDLNFDYLEEMDERRPLEAIARKLILNVNNGSFKRKIDNIKKLIVDLRIDGVIHFCQWGCKQSFGGFMLLKKEIEKMGIPFLAIDGDAVDRRNNPEEQINTRLSAFFELLEQREKRW